MAVACTASQRKVGSSFFQPNCTAVSRLPMATRTPAWCDAAWVGSTFRPNRRFEYRVPMRAMRPLGSFEQRDVCHTSTFLSSCILHHHFRRDRPRMCDTRPGQPTPPEGCAVVPPSTTNV